jgi:hypothetical protein
MLPLELQPEWRAILRASKGASIVLGFIDGDDEDAV